MGLQDTQNFNACGMRLKNTLSYILPLLVFISFPAFLHAEEPSSGTLIMISSVGAWFALLGIFAYMRRAHFMNNGNSK